MSLYHTTPPAPSPPAPREGLPTWLEDAAEAVGRMLQEGEALNSVDLTERTGLRIHQVRQALRFLQGIGVVGRFGRWEVSGQRPQPVIEIMPGGQLRFRTQQLGNVEFYYRWVRTGEFDEG